MFNFVKILLVFLALVSLNLYSFASAADKESSFLVEEDLITDESIISQELSKLLLEKTQFQADFSQRVTKNTASFIQQGRIYVQAPERVRLDITSPQKVSSYLLKDTLWRIQHPLKQIDVRHIDKDSTSNFDFLWRLDTEAIKQEFIFLSYRKEEQTFELKARNPKALLQDYVLVFDDKQQLAKIRMSSNTSVKDTSLNEISLSNYQALEGDVFSPELPADYAIVDLRR